MPREAPVMRAVGRMGKVDYSGCQSRK